MSLSQTEQANIARPMFAGRTSRFDRSAPRAVRVLYSVEASEGQGDGLGGLVDRFRRLSVALTI
jgi:hypothetical protein